MALRVRAPIRVEAEPTKGSRFIADVAPVADEDEAKAFLRSVAAVFPDASHHCWAWRIARPSIDRAGDDGEPAGSAGRPILAQLTGREVVDTAVVVTRWFGGTKLGVGGLVRAYGGAASAALDAADLDDWVAQVALTVVCEHGDSAAVERILQVGGVKEVDVAWGVRVTRHVLVAETQVDEMWRQLADATSGRVIPPAAS